MDIEGTTTSISFVHETLFPYAAQAVEAHLRCERYKYVCVYIICVCVCMCIHPLKSSLPSPPPPTHRSRLPSGDAECLADVAALRAQALADKEVSSCQPVDGRFSFLCLDRVGRASVK